mgnify:CR=1 FL=1
MKSYVAKPCDVNRKWYVVDAKDVVLGRLATEVASILRGKKNVRFQPSFDMGDYVIVVNAEKVKLTGNKLQQKEHRYYTGYSNGLKAISYEKMLQTKPEKVIELAVKGMLPKGPLGRSLYTKLHVYAGAEHTHAAQKPEVMEIKG